MVSYIAQLGVNTQFRDASDDPHIPDEKKHLLRIAGCTARQFKEALPYVENVFVIADGKWRLADPEVVRIARPSQQREAIPTQTKAVVIAREGRRCAYCGDTVGPFHFDHLFPWSKGGTDNPSNLIIACESCNRDKGDKTLLEWMAFRAGPRR